MVSAADGKPTAQSYDVFNILSDSLEAAITSLRLIVSEELPKVNDILKRNGLAPVTANIPGPKKMKFTP